MTYGEWVAHLTILGYSTLEIEEVLATNRFFIIDEDIIIYTVTETEC